MNLSPYREQVLEHYRNPRHRGRLASPDRVGELDNPVCGDQVRIELQMDGETVAGIAFDGEGCVIAIAAASMLAEYAHGRSAAELRAMSQQDVLAMLGVELGYSRSRCALLALEALQAALG
ncbi:MAG: iron-sulfur cluster assembly scaffold protein [Anaerolineae bacterium]|nr:iron-sulfur cluster assembly scaffold protein [Anaerolineae bacterium]